MIKEHTRIYIPGGISREIISSLSDLKQGIEVRDGYALPLPSEKYRLEKVWHVEFENANIPPKFYIGKKFSKYYHIDEIVQYRLHPTRGGQISTTSYPKSKVSESDLDFLKDIDEYQVRIIDGEHPLSDSYLDRCDGIIVLTGSTIRLDKIVDIVEKNAPHGIIVTSERLIFQR